MEIDIGTDATEDTASIAGLSGLTLVVLGNPANAAGKITNVKLKTGTTAPTDVEIGIFYNEGGDVYSTRDSQSIPNMNASTLYESIGVDLDVEIGDLIGIYGVQNSLAGDSDHPTGGFQYLAGDQIPCSEAEFGNNYANDIILYGTGAEVVVGGGGGPAALLIAQGEI